MPVVPERVKPLLRPALRRFRAATGNRRIAPSFLVIGAQRAGTTTLFYHLRRHPNITAPRGADPRVSWVKELHFFDEKFSLGFDWYRSFFPLEVTRRIHRRRGGEVVAGEATPSYIFHPLAPERVAATLPDVRLVALLRDPIERAYSHYQLMRRTGRETLSFEEALAKEEKRLAAVAGRTTDDGIARRRGNWRPDHHRRHRAYFARGLYAEQLERWFAHFPREQLLVVRAEDMLADPARIYADVLAFIGVAPWEPEDFTPRNVGAYAPIDPELRARLEERYAEPNERLNRLLGRDFGWASSVPAGPGIGAPRQASADG
ncbi:MAG TPA: sulfotransferase [Gaiellaceae bacterium]|nr:sulfotransferase [Gaiellaceae bacterium]